MPKRLGGIGQVIFSITMAFSEPYDLARHLRIAQAVYDHENTDR